jgi:hypothetical protein
VVSLLVDRARVQTLRRTLDLRATLEQLRREGWSPKRAAIALDLGETFLLRVLNGPTSARPKAEPMVRALAAELDERPSVAAALRGLVLESRGGLWPVEFWPTPRGIVQLCCRRALARECGQNEWTPTPLGVDVDAFRQRCSR